MIFDIFIYCTLIIYLFGNSIKEVTNIKKINIIYLIGCIILTIGTIYAAKYNIYIDNLMVKTIPIISTIFTLLITLLIYIKTKISRKN